MSRTLQREELVSVDLNPLRISRAEDSRNSVALPRHPVSTPVAPIPSGDYHYYVGGGGDDEDEETIAFDGHCVTRLRKSGKPSTRKSTAQTAIDLAVHDSLSDSGGLTLSLRGWFLESVPSLPPLELSLVYLNLSFNSLTAIPDVVFDCVNLKVLKLRNNPIAEIPDKIERLRRLRILVASFCTIRRISPNLYRLPLLLYLDLSYNRLVQVDPEIGHAKTLRFLNLAGNELRGLPKQAMRLNLEKIRLKNNFMKRVRNSITKLKVCAKNLKPY